MSNPVVVFLIWFIFVAIVVAAILISLEIWVGKRAKVEEVREKIKTPLDELSIFMNNDAGIKEKLDFIEKTAKSILREKYNIPLALNYDELAEHFREDGMLMEAEFCEKIFRSYYSNEKLTGAKLKELVNIINNIYVKPICHDDKWEVPNFIDGVNEFVEEVKDAVVGGVSKSFSYKNEVKKNDNYYPNGDYGLIKLIRKVIIAGYNKSNIIGILIRWGKSRNKMKKVLQICDKDTVKNEGKKPPVYTNKYYGIAQKIVQNEKNRLKGATLEAEF